MMRIVECVQDLAQVCVKRTSIAQWSPVVALWGHSIQLNLRNLVYPIRGRGGITPILNSILSQPIDFLYPKGAISLNENGQKLRTGVDQVTRSFIISAYPIYLRSYLFYITYLYCSSSVSKPVLISGRTQQLRTSYDFWKEESSFWDRSVTPNYICPGSMTTSINGTSGHSSAFWIVTFIVDNPETLSASAAESRQAPPFQLLTSTSMLAIGQEGQFFTLLARLQRASSMLDFSSATPRSTSTLLTPKAIGLLSIELFTMPIFQLRRCVAFFTTSGY